MRLDDEIWAFHTYSRDALRRGDPRMAEHWYRKLRAEHCVELIPELELHTPTKFVHPIGSVLGRAAYAPHLVVYQNVGVGSDLNGNRPTFQGPCVLFPGAKVLGKAVIGKNVYITANTVVKGIVVPDNSVVFPAMMVFGRDQGNGAGNYVTCDWKPTTRSVIADYFSNSAADPADMPTTTR